MKEVLESLGRFTAYLRSKGVSPELADDVLQEALVNALRKSHQIRDEGNVIGWFYAILRNTLVDVMRKKRADDVRAAGAAEYELLEDTSITPSDEHSNICICITPVLSSLPSSDQQLLRWVDIEEKDRDKIAKSLGLTASTLRARLSRARAKLRDNLESVCLACAKTGCQDCTCKTSQRSPKA